MIKKAVLGVGALGLLMVLFFGRDAASYVRTSFGWMKDSVKSSVPVEFEIQRAREMVQNLVPDIRKNMHVIAQEEVEIERLEKKIAQASSTLEKERAEILRLKNDLASNQTVYHYAGRSYSAQNVKCDLAARFERFKTHEGTLGSLREIQDTRRKALDVARQKLDSMLTQRRQLEVDVENLETNFKTVELAQANSSYNFDDSQLGRVKELISQVRTRLTVAERLANTSVELGGEIPLSTPTTTDDIVDQVTQYFNADKAPTQVAEAQQAN